MFVLCYVLIRLYKNIYKTLNIDSRSVNILICVQTPYANPNLSSSSFLLYQSHSSPQRTELVTVQLSIVVCCTPTANAVSVQTENSCPTYALLNTSSSVVVPEDSAIFSKEEIRTGPCPVPVNFSQNFKCYFSKIYFNVVLLTYSCLFQYFVLISSRTL